MIYFPAQAPLLSRDGRSNFYTIELDMISIGYYPTTRTCPLLLSRIGLTIWTFDAEKNREKLVIYLPAAQAPLLCSAEMEEAICRSATV